MSRKGELTHEERIGVIERFQRVKGELPDVGLVMLMWDLDEIDANMLLDEVADE